MPSRAITSGSFIPLWRDYEPKTEPCLIIKTDYSIYYYINKRHYTSLPPKKSTSTYNLQCKNNTQIWFVLLLFGLFGSNEMDVESSKFENVWQMTFDVLHIKISEF